MFISKKYIYIHEGKSKKLEQQGLPSCLFFFFDNTDFNTLLFAWKAFYLYLGAGDVEAEGVDAAGLLDGELGHLNGHLDVLGHQLGHLDIIRNILGDP